MPKSKPKPNTKPVLNVVEVLRPDGDFLPPPVSEMHLTKAVFIYEETIERVHQEDRYGGRRIPERVITVCDAYHDGTLAKPQLIDPVTFADAILDAHHQEDRETLVFQPANILASGRSALVWWRPAGPAKLYFKLPSGEDEPRYTALNGRDISLPALVFRGSAHGLMVWALAENKRPSPETRLMAAPFMNLINGGPQVCLGSARSADLRNATARASAPAEWERIFFESNFTHTPPALAYDATLQDYPTLLELCAQGAAAGFADFFPTCLLRPSKHTLADAIAGKA